MTKIKKLSLADRRASINFSLPKVTVNRIDCAYILLLCACGAAFLVATGGVVSYVAFLRIEASPVATHYLGPLLLVVGMIVFAVIIYLAYHYGCEYQPHLPSQMDAGYVNFVMMDEAAKIEAQVPSSFDESSISTDLPTALPTGLTNPTANIGLFQLTQKTKVPIRRYSLQV